MPKSIVGDVINFRGFVYGPVNEMGVVAIFSKISEDIGFIVEEIRDGYHNCIVRKQVGKGCEQLAMDFKNKRSNLLKHEHNPED